MFRGVQAGQTGPSGVRVLTGLRRPQRAHCSRLAGSVLRQCGQTGRPCSSRAAGSRAVPHRPHGTARARAQQPRQTRSPSTILLSATIRPHRGQEGRRIWVAPASQSASTSLSTMGNGASAPPPASSAGDSCSAHASFCRCAGLTTVASSTGCHGVRGQTRVGRGDDFDEHLAGVSGALAGALAAARPAMPVPGGDLPHVPARGAGQRPVETRRAVPAVAPPLHRGDLPRAARAPRWCDPGSAGGPQCQQQVTDRPRRR
jgi:hypothetical protein